MPIYLRKFYYNELTAAKKEEKKQMEEAKNKNKVKHPNPNFRR